MTGMASGLLRGAVVLALGVGGVAACGDEVVKGPLSAQGVTPAVETLDPGECPVAGYALWLREPSVNYDVTKMNVELYNCGGRRLTLPSRPAVRLLNGDRKPIKVKITPPTSRAATRSTGLDLAMGEVAALSVVWRDPTALSKKAAVTAEYLEIVPVPDGSRERLPGVEMNFGAVPRVDVVPWRKVREANGAEVGDGAPHYGDNHAYRQRLRLTPATRLRATAAARKIHTALEKARVRGGYTVPSVKAILDGLGLPPKYNHAYSFSSRPGIGYEAYPGGGACIYGELLPDRVTVKVDGVRVEGGCRED